MQDEEDSADPHPEEVSAEDLPVEASTEDHPEDHQEVTSAEEDEDHSEVHPEDEEASDVEEEDVSDNLPLTTMITAISPVLLLSLYHSIMD